MWNYILLICTWLFILVLTIFLWVWHSLEPPLWVIIILVCIALIPLAGRLKIGSWIDFTKKVDQLGENVSSVKKELDAVNNRINLIMSSRQNQQQFNISLEDEKAARSFAEIISNNIQIDYPPSNLKIISSTDDKSKFFSDDLSESDKLRFFFLQSADEAILSANLLCQLLYARKLAKEKGDRLNAQDVLGKNTADIIIELLDSKAFSGNLAEDWKKYLKSIADFIKLREDVYQNQAKPPPIEEGQILLRNMWHAIYWFHGMISALLSISWIVPRELDRKD